MFGNHYFANRYFADRYFPPGGEEEPETPPPGMPLIGGGSGASGRPHQGSSWTSWDGDESEIKRHARPEKPKKTAEKLDLEEILPRSGETLLTLSALLKPQNLETLEQKTEKVRRAMQDERDIEAILLLLH